MAKSAGKAPTGKVPLPPTPKGAGNSGKAPAGPEAGGKKGKTHPAIPKTKK